MYEKLFTIELPIQMSIGKSASAQILFGMRSDTDKVTVYIVEVSFVNVTRSHDIQDQMPLIERKCRENLSTAKPLN
jgi:hypothetical protein